MSNTKQSKFLYDLERYLDVSFYGKSGEELIGYCPFCKKDKFFFNKEKNVWHCKHEDKGGSKNQLITYFSYLYLKNVDINRLKELANYRGLPVSSFQGRCFYHNRRFFFPIKDVFGNIISLQHYCLSEKLKTFGGLNNELYNCEYLPEADAGHIPIYICEGIFDVLSLEWLLKKNNKEGVCIGLPGVSIKHQWYNFFVSKRVIICFDNDHAGEINTAKIGERLKSTGTPINKIEWLEEFPSGYDLNDFISAFGVKPNTPKDCWQHLCKQIVPYNTYIPQQELSIIDQERLKNLLPEKEPDYTGVTFSFEDIIDEYRKTLEVTLDFETAIWICMAVVLSAKIKGGDPLWLFFVGPPGWGKTAILSSFRKSKETCVFQSSIHKQSLISGFNIKEIDKDPSLIPYLDGKCLVLKDFTEVLKMNQNAKEETFGVLRGIFDGYLDKSYGAFVKRNYESSFSILAGVTQEIILHSQASCGERFLRFHLQTKEVDSKKQQKAALINAFTKKNVKAELQFKVNYFLNQFGEITKEFVDTFITEEFINKIVSLSKLTAWIRTPVIREEGYGASLDPLFDPEVESGTRIGVQLQRLAIFLAIIKNETIITSEIYTIIKRVALDSIQGYNIKVIKYAVQHEYVTISELSKAVKISIPTITKILKNLIILGLVKKGENIRTGKNFATTYAVLQEIKQLWKEAEL